MKARLALVLSGLLVAIAACASTPTVEPGPTQSPGAHGPRVEMVTLGGYESVGRNREATPTWMRTIIAEELPIRAVTVNLANPTATVVSARKTQLPRALAQRPTIATVWFGPADALAGTSLETFTTDLGDMVSELQDAGAKVLVVVGSIGLPKYRFRQPSKGPTPKGAPGGDRDRATIDLTPYFDAARSVAEAKGATEVEIPSGLSFDDAGQQSVATAVAKAIGPIR